MSYGTGMAPVSLGVGQCTPAVPYHHHPSHWQVQAVLNNSSPDSLLFKQTAVNAAIRQDLQGIRHSPSQCSL